MSRTAELDIPKSAKARELRRLAGEFAKDSIVTDALSRLIEQVIEVATEHAREAAADRIAKLEAALERARTVLGNMAQENEGAIFNRWPISHEPLRNDARNLLPILDEALGRGE